MDGGNLQNNNPGMILQGSVVHFAEINGIGIDENMHANNRDRSEYFFAHDEVSTLTAPTFSSNSRRMDPAGNSQRMYEPVGHYYERTSGICWVAQTPGKWTRPKRLVLTRLRTFLHHSYNSNTEQRANPCLLLLRNERPFLMPPGFMLMLKVLLLWFGNALPPKQIYQLE